ncbi:conserved hypothetical protein [Vibrio nigripulchritudo SFn27]|uniref:Uncharacterized protein n=1 Tax=Vibrio nigripulchritudo TaxID=28173 RepID=A0A9P1JLD8_9VIBR|nr:hypothetical protein [Vibrio nigripulchritudo]CBJ93221.1 Conserved hypothetical protein [Vibrio nigripulchritudo]CCN86045.1 conserved hypothetical protein [Vibrio nigripulchritudo BLFn1]CCN92032.1 conserved hypothetical protein [Vibrio nigripulchritudo SFn27]CCN97843.1 conserved hypothetical protein [Vibrio nigripulchritudo ENn2]CCO44066.1 conserved hypothetical protein [Vibrio nigripulchritudo SFn135]
MFDDSKVPEWANRISVAKGLGFETPGLKGLMWSHFYEHSSDTEFSQFELERRLGNFLEGSIRRGSVSKANKILKCSRVNLHNQSQPVKYSAFVQFEEKYKCYFSGAPEEFFNRDTEYQRK